MGHLVFDSYPDKKIISRFKQSFEETLVHRGGADLNVGYILVDLPKIKASILTCITTDCRWYCVCVCVCVIDLLHTSLLSRKCLDDVWSNIRVLPRMAEARKN